MHFNSKRCLTFPPLPPRQPCLLTKGGVALLQSTLDDVEHCDWLTDIQSNMFVPVKVKSGESYHGFRHAREVKFIGIDRKCELKV